MNENRSNGDPTEGDLIQISLWEHKVEEVSVFLLVSALVFGFAVSLFFGVDTTIFKDDEVLLCIFIFSLGCTINGSLWSTVVTAGTLVLARGYLNNNQVALVEKIFADTVSLRTRNRLYCYIAFVCLMVSVLVYGMVIFKHDKNALIVHCVVYAGGLFGMAVSFTELKYLYSKLNKFEKHQTKMNEYDKFQNNGDDIMKYAA